MNLKQLVLDKLNVPGRCYGHCKQKTSLRFLQTDGTLIACNACPQGYVSRIVAYSKTLDLPRFKKFLSDATSQIQEVLDEDIRVATRYSWDLGLKEEPDEKILSVAYWNQSYRRTKSDDPNRNALFLCSRCGSLYVQKASGKESICGKCRTVKA